MNMRVGLAGYNELGKRVADAVAAQSDMALVGVCETSAADREAAAGKGYAVCAGLDELQRTCDAIVNCGAAAIESERTVIDTRVRGDGCWPLVTALSDAAALRGCTTLCVPDGNVVALARVVRAAAGLGAVERLTATVVMGGGSGRRDALEVVFDAHDGFAGAPAALAGTLATHHLRQVRAACTRSHLQMIKLDFAAPIDAGRLGEALRQAPRILVAAAGDGFANTADVQEFFRDLGRPRADRPELFVWSESVMAVGASGYLMVDVDPQATAVPEIVDAVRLSRGGVSPDVARRVTDQALGLVSDLGQLAAGGRSNS